MTAKVTEITYDVTLKPGEALSIPEEAAQILGPGHWLVSIRPAHSPTPNEAVRNHEAFLRSYSAEDEGLYDDYSAG